MNGERSFDVVYTDSEGERTVRRIEARNFIEAESCALTFVPSGENFLIRQISEDDANLYDISVSCPGLLSPAVRANFKRGSDLSSSYNFSVLENPGENVDYLSDDDIGIPESPSERKLSDIYSGSSGYFTYAHATALPDDD